jgi:hypothetical protein
VINFSSIFQPKASTSMCSWAATAVRDHYNRQGAVVYGCAFDIVEWLNLFNVVVSRNVAPVSIVYLQQSKL